jgi:hypothetical protein
MKLFLLLTSAAALILAAANINGTWKGTAETPMGNIERTFVFKADGKKLTGETTSSMMGKSTIQDGVIDGDNISFWIKASYQGQEMKINYKGQVNGDEMKLEAEVPDADQSVTYTVKRVSE